MQLDQGSRFQGTPTVLLMTTNGQLVETMGVWKRPAFLRIRPNPDQIGTYQVQTGRVGRPDLIAAELYGSAFLDWILIAFNQAMDVLNWPQAGMIIEYPLPRLIFAELD